MEEKVNWQSADSDKVDYKPIQTVISPVTDKAIKEGFWKSENGHEYDNLHRAQARASRLATGMNGTRAPPVNITPSLVYAYRHIWHI